MVEAALGRREVGSLLFVTDPVETNRLQRLTVEGHRLGIPAGTGTSPAPRCSPSATASATPASSTAS